MKEAFNFGESMIFRWNSDFKKEPFSSKLTPKPGLSESVVNDRNVNIIGAVLEENRQVICEEFVASINILKTSIFSILQLQHVCSRWVSPHFTKEQMEIRIHQYSKWK